MTDQFSSAREASRRTLAQVPFWILAVCALLFSALFTAVSIQIHGTFQTSAYDLGLFDQAFWRYSRGLSNFNTLRGMNILGDHFSPIALIFAPLYRVWPDISWAFALQALSVAGGSLMLYLIARHLLPRRPWIGLAVALAYLLHPVVHNTLLWQYHEIVLASGLYLLLIWSYLKDRFLLFLASFFLLLCCREDMPVTLAAFGVLALIERRWRYGGVAIVASLIWWLVVTRLAMPYFNGVGYFRATHGTISNLLANWANPAFYYGMLSTPQAMGYLLKAALPALLPALLAPRYLLPALPTLAANVLIGGYNTNIDFHYSVNAMPFLFWAALAGLQRVDAMVAARGRGWQRLPGGLAWSLTLAAALMAACWSAMPLRDLPARYEAWKNAQAAREHIAQIHTMIGNAGVAASDWLAPHLAHRERIYLFPNPWRVHYWGVREDHPHHPNQVDYLVLSPDAVADHGALVDYLLASGTFTKISEQQRIVVMKRVKPEAADRTQAVAAYQRHSQIPPIPFGRITLSPQFKTEIKQFDTLHYDIGKLRHQSFPGAQAFAGLGLISEIDIELGPANASDGQTRYVRAEVDLPKHRRATLLLGSDDGVTVWLNQAKIHENLVLRPSNLGDDRIGVDLRPGRNVLVFRVNNASGAWRLQALLKVSSK